MTGPRNRHRRDELDRPEALAAHLERTLDLSGWVVQALDLREVPELDRAEVLGTIFLGCVFRGREHELELTRRGAAVFPRFTGLPYTPYRGALYTADELLEGYDEGGYTATRDFRIYAHFERDRSHPDGISIRESLAQSLHDHGVEDALQELLEEHAGQGVVGVMGGHGTPRSDRWFLEVARLGWSLARRGYLVASGGGPGIMEAANLGAFLSNYADPAVLEAAAAQLAQADRFDGGQPEGSPAYLTAVRNYFRCAREVRARFADPAEADARAFARERPEPGVSLAVPTWFYGHEPTNLFAAHVAKYFSNSLREDGLLAISTAGVVFAPGSAGTLQEVFMDLAQNHYATFTYRSPMVFLSRERWSELFRFLEAFVAERRMEAVYGDLLTLVDTAEEAAEFVVRTPPRRRVEATPLYELEQ